MVPLSRGEKGYMYPQIQQARENQGDIYSTYDFYKNKKINCKKPSFKH